MKNKDKSRISKRDQLLISGRDLHRKGQLIKAKTLYEQVLSKNPMDVDALNLLGVLEQDRMNYDAAMKHFMAALEANNTTPQIYSNIGNLLNKQKRYAESIDYYDRAISINPGHLLAWYNKGVVLVNLKKYQNAINCFKEALKIDPDHAQSIMNSGMSYREIGEHQAAIDQFNLYLKIDPKNRNALNNLALSYIKLGDYKNALGVFDQTLSIFSGDSEALNNKVNALVRLGEYEDALISSRDLLSIDPIINTAYIGYINIKAMICDWSNYNEHISNLSDLIYDESHSILPLVFLAHVDDPLKQQLVASKYAPTTPGDATALPERQPSQKIRIGYYSADLRTHAVTNLMAQVFELHDKERFEIYAFSMGARRYDHVTERLQRAFDRFIDISNMTDREVADLSRSIGIDIAVDLMGYTRDSRPDIFAYRCAPIQVNYLGYPGTMGADFMDYIIADEIIIPKEQQKFYTEEVLYLPHTYQPNDATRTISERVFTRDGMGLPKEAFVFCSFNTAYKITPLMFDSWMRILHSVPKSVLWLKADNPTALKNLRLEAEQRGIDPSRLIFTPGIKSFADHLARHRLADLFLDTHPYNAHTTASDALWAGLPVLTVLGKSFTARVCASVLSAIGLSELVAESIEKYEELAIQIGNNPEAIKNLKLKLDRNRLTTPLFNSKQFTHDLEDIFQKIFESKKYEGDFIGQYTLRDFTPQ